MEGARVRQVELLSSPAHDVDLALQLLRGAAASRSTQRHQQSHHRSDERASKLVHVYARSNMDMIFLEFEGVRGDILNSYSGI